jgi:phosphatidylinositol kinase/protein kinase (PI-3  family)
MEALQIKETLHEYIDTADDKKLEAIYTMLKDGISPDFEYSKDELAAIYARRDKYKNGEEETLTAEEFINYIHKKKL